MNTVADNYNSIANHNLSSVLSQIQDNGPACDESRKQNSSYNNMFSKTKTDNNTAAVRQPGGESYEDDTVSISSNAPQQQQSRAASSAIVKKEISPGVWLQLLLLLISAALLASMLFRMDAQSNEFENSLSSYDEIIDEKIQESVDLQKGQTSSGTIKIREKLQSLQNELQTIKTDYSALDKKYVALAQSEITETSNETASIKDDVSIFKYEILSLKSELQAVKNKLKIVKTLPAQAAADSGLIVMLASLTNKTRAEKIVQQLYAEGLKPSLKPAIVKGEKVYRLSVSGFYNRDEAELFIRKADKKYGMKNSRIRKG